MTATKYLTATPLTSALYGQFTAPDRPGSNAALALKEHAERMEGDRARLIEALHCMIAWDELMRAKFKGRYPLDLRPAPNVRTVDASALLRSLGKGA